MTGAQLADSEPDVQAWLRSLMKKPQDQTQQAGDVLTQLVAKAVVAGLATSSPNERDFADLVAIVGKCRQAAAPETKSQERRLREVAGRAPADLQRICRSASAIWESGFNPHRRCGKARGPNWTSGNRLLLKRKVAGSEISNTVSDVTDVFL
jgi:uncharacterized protein with von Willebrand factor type A (vWA) domain